MTNSGLLKAVVNDDDGRSFTNIIYFILGIV